MRWANIKEWRVENMPTLLLRLGAPLQSWGSSSVYDSRETDDMPTKSGVIGMLASALGRKRDEPVDDLSRLKFGVRIDQPGIRISDFQITEMSSVKGNKLNSNLSTKIYLSDALFLVGLESSNREILEQIGYAINHPVYVLYLGRRSCPPTMPLNLGIREENLEGALRNEPSLVSRDNRNGQRRSNSKRIVIESLDVEEAIKKDVPISFSPYHREYGYRYMKELEPYVENEDFKGEDIELTKLEHDPMKELR